MARARDVARRIGQRVAPVRRWVHRYAVTVFVVVVLGSITLVFYFDARTRSAGKTESNARIADVDRVLKTSDYNTCLKLNKVIDVLASFVDDRSPQRATANLALRDPTATPTQKERAAVTIQSLDIARRIFDERLQPGHCEKPVTAPR